MDSIGFENLDEDVGDLDEYGGDAELDGGANGDANDIADIADITDEEKEGDLEGEDEEEEVEEEEIEETVKVGKKKYTIVRNEDRKTSGVMSKYEKARILSIRAEDINKGAQPLIDTTPEMDPLDIAKREMTNKLDIPIMIERVLPEGKIERWSFKELIDIYS